MCLRKKWNSATPLQSSRLPPDSLPQERGHRLPQQKPQPQQKQPQPQQKPRHKLLPLQRRHRRMKRRAEARAESRRVNRRRGETRRQEQQLQPRRLHLRFPRDRQFRSLHQMSPLHLRRTTVNRSSCSSTRVNRSSITLVNRSSSTTRSSFSRRRSSSSHHNSNKCACRDPRQPANQYNPGCKELLS